VGGRRVRDQLLRLAVRSQAPHAPCRIGDAALALVGEVKVAVVGEVQIVQALEALAERAAEHFLYLAALRIEREEPAPVVGDEGTPVAMELEPVRPAVVLHREVPAALGIDAEDAPVRDVHAPKVAL